jgi:hypothetical protein
VLLERCVIYGGFSMEEARDVKAFLNLSRWNRLRFSASGLFEVDMTLLVGFVGTVATYVVILLAVK